MNSLERKDARYQRRKAKRNNDQYKDCDDFDKVFTYEHLYESYKKARQNVAWKASVQSYITEAPLKIYQTYEMLKEGIYVSRGFYEFDIFERGKQRHIKSVCIDERVVQRCLCDYCLVPILSRSFIYDNGACLKDKGYTFAQNRVVKHLRDYYRHFGNDGYVLIFDFKKYFDNISHDVIKKILHKAIKDERIIKQTEHFIDMFGNVGVGLGSQISQIFALAVPNYLDHFIKEKLHIKYYGRYMDDGYLIHNSKEYLQYCLQKISDICDKLGIKLNLKKTQIIKLSRGFTFLKAKFLISKTGKIIKRLARKSITTMRRKLKKFIKKLNDKFTKKDVYQSYQSWRAYANNFDSHRTVCNIDKLYKKLFCTIEGDNLCVI